jgi:hypothetical protein
MYIATIPNRSSPPAVLLREGYREDGKVKTRTLANLSRLPPVALAALRQILKGDKLIKAGDAFEAIASPHHGHVQAVWAAMQRLSFANIIASRRSRQRDLVVAMVVARILEPDSKLAMDWLLKSQRRIEKKLAARHLQDHGLVLYDLSSSYFEGVTCPLAARGHNRDRKKGKLQVNFGLLTDQRGVPVSIWRSRDDCSEANRCPARDRRNRLDRRPSPRGDQEARHERGDPAGLVR